MSLVTSNIHVYVDQFTQNISAERSLMQRTFVNCIIYFYILSFSLLYEVMGELLPLTSWTLGTSFKSPIELWRPLNY